MLAVGSDAASSLRSSASTCCLLNLMQDPRHNLGILYMEYIMQAAAKEAEAAKEAAAAAAKEAEAAAAKEAAGCPALQRDPPPRSGGLR